MPLCNVSENRIGGMKLIDVLTSPWAIMPEKLREIQAVYGAHFRGEKIDIQAIEARLGHPLANDQQDYEIRDGGVAVLSISGVISNKANMFTRVSGGASAQILQQQVESMRSDPSVRAVVLDFDTPGGNVLGIPALCESIRALAAEKPTVSVCTGMMASAGYWLGSAANAVYISGLTDYVGSIGVVTAHKYDPRSAGTQTTELTAGKYKRIVSDYQPLSAEGKAYMQSQIDHIYSVFVDTVAENRKVSADQVLENMADGRIFIGQQAIDAGLADGVATVDAMVAKLAENPGQFEKRRKARFGAASDHQVAGAAADVTQADVPVLHVKIETNPKGPTMTPQEIAAKFVAENAEAAALVRAEGAEAERARIKAVREQSMPGHEKLIEQLAFDGKTTPGDAAIAVNAAERNRMTALASDRNSDAVGLVETKTDKDEKAAPVSAINPNLAREGFQVDPAAAKIDAEARAYMAANAGADYLAAVRAVSK